MRTNLAVLAATLSIIAIATTFLMREKSSPIDNAPKNLVLSLDLAREKYTFLKDVSFNIKWSTLDGKPLILDIGTPGGEPNSTNPENLLYSLHYVIHSEDISCDLRLSPLLSGYGTNHSVPLTSEGITQKQSLEELFTFNEPLYEDEIKKLKKNFEDGKDIFVYAYIDLRLNGHFCRAKSKPVKIGKSRPR